jgi:hypothetical protein
VGVLLRGHFGLQPWRMALMKGAGRSISMDVVITHPKNFSNEKHAVGDGQSRGGVSSWTLNEKT